MATLLCASVTGNEFSGAFGQLRRIEKEADIVELRLDKMTGFDIPNLKRLIPLAKKPIIATYRAEREGGEGSASDSVRVDFLKHCIDAGASFVDIELSTSKPLVRELVRYAHAHGTKVIVSFHDFTKMPSLPKLLRFAQEAHAIGADVVKAAALVKRPADNKTVFSLMDYCKRKRLPFIAIGMGDSATRFKAINKGAFLTFGRIGEGSAPGQPLLKDLRAYRRKLLVPAAKKQIIRAKRRIVVEKKSLAGKKPVRSSRRRRK